MAAVAGLLAGLAPLAEWYRLDIAFDPRITVSMMTNGWGSTSIDTSMGVPPDSVTGTPSWDGWTIADIPDGAVASLLGAFVLVAGLRMVLGGRRPGAPGAIVGGVGVLGLMWCGAAWFTARDSIGRVRDTFALGGASPTALEDMISGSTGIGLVLTAVGFVLAAVVGFAVLWSSTTQAAPQSSSPPPAPLPR